MTIQRNDTNVAMPAEIPARHFEFSAAPAARWLAVLALIVVALTGSATHCVAATHVLTAEAKRDLRLQPGVVFIRTTVSISSGSNNFSCTSSGTGFLYRPDGYIITNGHVVESANVKEYTSLQKLLKQTLESCSANLIRSQDWTDAQKLAFIRAAQVNKRPDIEVTLDNGERHKGEIKLMSESIDDGGKDVAIIKIDGQNLPTVPLGRSSDVNVGDQITVIGYPGAANAGVGKESILVPTVTNGKISALKQDFKGTPLLQSEVNINHGNSGGPAFDAEGRAIGIATFGADQVAGFNFFVPIDTAWEFVRQVGALPQSGSFDAVWNEALNAFADQHWSKAHALLGNVLEMMPNQQDAAKLLKDSAIKEQAESPIERIIETLTSANKTVLTGVGLILAALLVGGFILLRNGQKPGPKLTKQSQPVTNQAANKTVVESLGSLYVSSGPTKGRQYPIPKDGLRIGRDADSCTIVLPLETVGREHAWIMPMEDGQVAIIDRGSTNGTYLNSVDGSRVKKAFLKTGDRILIGRENPVEILYQRS